MSSAVIFIVMFGVDAIGDHILKAYSSTGLVTTLCVKSNVSLCFPNLVEEKTLSICIVLDAFAIVLSMCLTDCCNVETHIWDVHVCPAWLC